LLDLVGNVLRSLFGVATIADLHELNLTLDEMKLKYADIVYSLTNQVTYIRNVDHIGDLRQMLLLIYFLLKETL